MSIFFLHIIEIYISRQKWQCSGILVRYGIFSFILLMLIEILETSLLHIQSWNIGFIHCIKVISWVMYCMQCLRFERNMFKDQWKCNKQKIQCLTLDMDFISLVRQDLVLCTCECIKTLLLWYDIQRQTTEYWIRYWFCLIDIYLLISFEFPCNVSPPLPLHALDVFSLPQIFPVKIWLWFPSFRFALRPDAVFLLFPYRVWERFFSLRFLQCLL